MDYEQIKGMAEQGGMSVKELIALAPQNDPFYTGTPADVRLGEWFATLWHGFGYGGGVHIRRMHYQLISQRTPVTLPDGAPYVNTDKCWDTLTQASKVARYLELVSPASFVDRRNPEAVSYVTAPPEGVEVDVNAGMWDPPALPPFPTLPDYDLSGYWGEQRYHLELWAEKSTMNDILLPVCQRFGAVLQTGLGELSITATLAAVERIVERDKPARIFYVSDFDPAGQSMPVAVARKIEYFIYRGGHDVDVMLIPVVLNMEQVQQYRLPRTPIKEKEKRAGAFEARYGSGAVELDALEALHPGRLSRILRDAMRVYYDDGLDARVGLERDRLEGDLAESREMAIEPYQEDIDALQQEYEEIRGDISQRLDAINARLTDVWENIAARLEDNRPDVDNYPIPEPDEVDDSDTEALYDSGRDYVSQIGYYKEFQGK